MAEICPQCEAAPVWKVYTIGSDSQNCCEDCYRDNERYDGDHPKMTCFRCEEPLNSLTVMFCNEEQGCETWYCHGCYNNGQDDCPLCCPDPNGEYGRELGLDPAYGPYRWSCGDIMDGDGHVVCKQCWRNFDTCQGDCDCESESESEVEQSGEVPDFQK